MRFSLQTIYVLSLKKQTIALPAMSYIHINHSRLMKLVWDLQLVNHGVESGLLQQIKDDITEFFSLPLEEKLAVAIQPNGLQGFGHHFVFSKEQKLDWADLLFLATRPVEERSLDFWPTKPSTFR